MRMILAAAVFAALTVQASAMDALRPATAFHGTAADMRLPIRPCPPHPAMGDVLTCEH